jgi:phage FluMu gp28-like protein
MAKNQTRQAKISNKQYKRLAALCSGILYDYQLDWLRDQSQCKISLKSRQIGYSTVAALEALLEAVEFSRLIIIVSASEDLALEFSEKVKKWDRIISEYCGLDLLLPASKKKELKTANGGRIKVLACNPSTIRSFSGTVYLDEFAFHQDPAAVYAAAFPSITNGFNIRIISTGCGEIGRYYELWSDPDNDFSKHCVNIEQASQQGHPVKIDFIKKNTDADTYEQEYMCAFLAKYGSFLNRKLLETAFEDTLGSIANKKNPFFIGVDIGRVHDLTVFSVMEKSGDRLYLREMIELEKVAYKEQKKQLWQLIDEYSPEKVGIDCNGIGNQLAEETQDEYYGISEGIEFTNKSKQEMATKFKISFENRSIKIPALPELTADLLKVKRKVTASGLISYIAERTKDGHSDRFWSLALANYMASTLPIKPAGGTLKETQKQTSNALNSHLDHYNQLIKKIYG